MQNPNNFIPINMELEKYYYDNNSFILKKKDKDKIIMMKFENDFIYKKFIYQGLMTDWAISSINNEDFISRWSVY